MRWFTADLHVHTALSPCASEEMTPPTIVKKATERGLEMIAICDHNSAGNVAAVQRAAAGRICVLAGIEVMTSEDVHVIGIFPDAEAAGRVADLVLRTLPPARSRELTGQSLLDEMGALRGREPRMLDASSPFPLAETVNMLKQHGGLVVAAHVDRRSFGVLGQLGLWPADAGFDAIEISAAGMAAGREAELAGIGLPMLTASDSHFADDIGSSFTALHMREPGFAELTAALRRPIRRGRRHA